MRLQAHFLAADFASPRVVAVWSSVAEFQAFAIRLCECDNNTTFSPLDEYWVKIGVNHGLHTQKE